MMPGGAEASPAALDATFSMDNPEVRDVFDKDRTALRVRVPSPGRLVGPPCARQHGALRSNGAGHVCAVVGNMCACAVVCVCGLVCVAVCVCVRTCVLLGQTIFEHYHRNRPTSYRNRNPGPVNRWTFRDLTRCVCVSGACCVVTSIPSLLTSQVTPPTTSPPPPPLEAQSRMHRTFLYHLLNSYTPFSSPYCTLDFHVPWC
jgi:hypothetical protein